MRLFGYDELDKFIKPLLMPALLYYLIDRAAGKIYKKHLWIATALIFAWIGDIMLLNKEQPFFLAGVASFLITQAIYTYLFFTNRSGALGSAFNDNKMSTIIISVVYIVFINLIFVNISGGLKFAVLIYATTITLATASAFYQDKNIKGYQFMCLGMSLFFVSDATIAIDMFIEPIPGATTIIMATYGVAQYFIVEGLIRSLE
ncbi:MAG: lysoplasmalogenase [Cyclobacteriaceae bacterium]